MEKTSGLKECPQCGLRNRQGAIQCDFCGWDFKESSDDWMGKVSDLEKLGKEASSSDIDRNTRSKIELTITKPADAPVKAKPVEQPKQVDEHPASVPDAQEDVLTLTEMVEVQVEVDASFSPADEPILPETSTPEVVAPPEPLVEEAVVPIETNEGAEVKIEATVEAEIIASEEVNHTSEKAPLITYAMVGTGVGMYAIDIFLTTSHVIDKVIGWAVIIAASALIALSVMKLLPRFISNDEGEEEVFLCPVCHELVEEAESRCPSCGANFKDASARE